MSVGGSLAQPPGLDPGVQMPELPGLLSQALGTSGDSWCSQKTTHTFISAREARLSAFPGFWSYQALGVATLGCSHLPDTVLRCGDDLGDSYGMGWEASGSLLARQATMWWFHAPVHTWQLHNGAITDTFPSGSPLTLPWPHMRNLAHKPAMTVSRVTKVGLGSGAGYFKVQSRI